MANGDTNPLWRDKAYAEKSPWGGIVAPLYIYTAASIVALPAPPEIEGFNMYAAGNHVEFHVPIRPGDKFTAEDVWLGVEDRSRPGRPHRTLLPRGETLLQPAWRAHYHADGPRARHDSVARPW